MKQSQGFNGISEQCASNIILCFDSMAVEDIGRRKLCTGMDGG